jgi:hypothetical protein
MECERVSAVRLRIPGGDLLDQYIFVDEKHATEWLKQRFVNDEEYFVELGSVEKTPCCGRRLNFQVSQSMKPSEYLRIKREWV